MNQALKNFLNMLPRHGELTKSILESSSKLGLDLSVYEENMRYHEWLDQLEFTYYGPGEQGIHYMVLGNGRCVLYNCLLKLKDRKIPFLSFSGFLEKPFIPAG